MKNLILTGLLVVSTSVIAEGYTGGYAYAPKIYTSTGEYLGVYSDDVNGVDSISNPNGIYGYKNSADNIHSDYRNTYGSDESSLILDYGDDAPRLIGD